MPSRPLELPQLRALTGLRFVAALAVLVFHALFTFSRASLLLPLGVMRSLLGSGYVGVNFFFVLSGFVLAYAYVDPGAGRMSTSALRFWRARFARVYPMYVVGLLLAFPLFVLGSEANHAAPGAIGAEGAKELALSALLVQAWVPSHALDLNGPAWSLSCEAFFYLLFPLLARVLGRAKRPALVVIAALAWGAAITPALVHKGPLNVLAHTSDLDLVLLYDPLVRLPDFVVGVAAGVLFVRREGAWTRAPIAAAATALLIVTILSASTHLPFLLLHNGLLDPLWALLTYALAERGADGAKDERGIASAPLVRGGKASYSLYVLHKPLYFWGTRWMNIGPLPPSAFFAAYVAGSVVAAVVAWTAVEEPLRRKIGARRD